MTDLENFFYSSFPATLGARIVRVKLEMETDTGRVITCEPRADVEKWGRWIMQEFLTRLGPKGTA